MASTRFSPPRIGSKTVRRADLLTHLERMRHATLALVTGSAGYGKTTLLAQWRERCVKAGADVAWLSLSADEADWSLAAAARRVHLSQPALTRSIQALEAQAGLPLCERGPRGVKLNAAGQMVAERARRILFETNSLARDLVLLQQHEVGSVDFGLGPLPAAIMLPEVLCTLNRDWPGLRVNAEVNEGEALVESLRTERLDFVVVEHRYAPLSAELKIHRLPVEPAGCFVRPQHPLLAGEMTVERLRQAALACVRAPHSAQQRMREVLGCLPGENLRFQVVTNDFHALVHVTRRSDLVLLSPTRAVQNELQTGSLVQLTAPAIFNLSAQFAVVSLTQRALSPSAQRAIVAIEAASGSTASASFPEQPA